MSSTLFVHGKKMMAKHKGLTIVSVCVVCVRERKMREREKERGEETESVIDDYT